MKKRHVHDLSNYDWSTLRAGEISPIKVVEVLGGDTLEIKSEAILRLDALDAPTMHPLKARIFHFYCANRQVSPGWNNFITQGANGVNTYVHPYVNLTSLNTSAFNLAGRLGLPELKEGVTEQVSAFPFAHYWNIVGKYFTDIAIQGEINPVLTEGDNTTNVANCFDSTTFINGFNVANANWKKDYFNTARIDPQLGGAVPIPQSNIQSNEEIIKLRHTNPDNTGNLVINTSNELIYGGTTPAASAGARFGDEPGLEMDESATMRDLSIAGALQIFRENRAQWGSRIIDYLRKGFGSKISSYELQEPVLLNYGEKTIRFSEVLQTGEGENPVGTLRGHGIGGLGSNKSHFRVPENGFVITLALVMPEPVYMRSAEKFWFKKSFMDYFQPEFESIGNMAILNKEIAFGLPDNDGDFGYQNPYDEYRRCLSTVKGSFRDTDKNWHMAREFGAGDDVVPVLNPGFLIGAPTQRIFADQLSEVYKLFSYNHLVARRVVKRNVKKRIL